MLYDWEVTLIIFEFISNSWSNIDFINLCIREIKFDFKSY